MMSLHFHDLLKLISVPVLDQLVLTCREEVVRILLESNLHDGVLMGKEALVAIAEI